MGTDILHRFSRPSTGAALVITLALAGCDHGGGSGGDPVAAPPGDQPAFPLIQGHVDQQKVANGQILFGELFGMGDELFEAQFNGLDGVGMLALPDGTPFPNRFSRVPPGGGRFTGVNAQACVGCHNSPLPTSAGEAAGNVFQDPARTGVGPFNPRNTTSLFGAAVMQRLAEEITEDLHAIRDAAAAAAAPGGPPVVRPLTSKGVDYGAITATRDLAGAVTFDLTGVRGVDPDLVVRPYGWKGNVASLRDFCRGAAMNELGMEGDEVVAQDPLGRIDPDGDGVTGELSIGDITAITIYVGAQEIPQTVNRLASDGLLPPPTTQSAALVAQGGALFTQIGCAVCHIPEMQLLDPTFEEPTLRGRGNYIDPAIVAATGYDPARPFRFNLVREGDFPRLVPHPNGGARVPLLGDLKRHFMGAALADPQAVPVNRIDGAPLVVNGAPVVIPAAVFLTPELWGVGNTGPWLHDGRAGSLEEAILLHGVAAPPPPGDPARSEAQDARDAFAALAADDRLAVVEMLRSLILFALPEEEEE